MRVVYVPGDTVSPGFFVGVPIRKRVVRRQTFFNVADEPHVGVRIVVVGYNSWGAGGTRSEALKNWRRNAPQGARVDKTATYVAIDERVLTRGDMPDNNWADADDRNAAWISIDDMGRVEIRHCIVIRH